MCINKQKYGVFSTNKRDFHAVLHIDGSGGGWVLGACAGRERGRLFSSKAIFRTRPNAETR